MDSKKEVNRQSRRKALMTFGAIAGTSTLGVLGNNKFTNSEEQNVSVTESLPLFLLETLNLGNSQLLILIRNKRPFQYNPVREEYLLNMTHQVL